MTIRCRNASCPNPSDYVEPEAWPFPGRLGMPNEAWRPVCWEHALQVVVGAAGTARHPVTLASIGYALDRVLPLVEYVKDRGNVLIDPHTDEVDRG